MKERTLTLRDGHRLFFRVWEVDSPAATVHINHGMTEHSLRYDGFAHYLNSLGFTVYAQDHRGHGYTKEEGEQGWFADKDGWNVVVEDAWELDCLIRAEHPSIPHFLFGHSMGSFVTRTEIQRHSEEWKAVVICGTGASHPILSRAGKFLSGRHAAKNGSRTPDAFLNNMAFSSYNRKFGKTGSESRWLSRDEKEVGKYDDDPLCGFVCSASFYGDLSEGVETANNRKKIAEIRKDLPLLIISGDEDPVGGYGKGVRKVAELYRNAGIKDVRLELRKGARHEILNELDKDEVMKIIGDFFLSVLKANDERQ